VEGPAVVEAGKELVSHDPAKAKAMLDAAGYALDGDVRKAPDGTPLEFELVMPSGWSDWVQAGQIIAQNLKEIGVRVKLRRRRGHGLVRRHLQGHVPALARQHQHQPDAL